MGDRDKMEHITEADANKLEELSAQCFNEGVVYRDSGNIIEALGCFEVAWALARYTEHIALMNISSDSLSNLGLCKRAVEECKRVGYEIVTGGDILECLIKGRTPKV